MQPRTILSLGFAMVIGLGTSLAQQSRTGTNNASAPRPRPAPVVSPELKSGEGVVFRYSAPKASEVKVVGQFGAETVLKKDDRGLWSGTVSVMPGIYEYRYVVDGVSTIDPQNSWIKPQRRCIFVSASKPPLRVRISFARRKRVP